MVKHEKLRELHEEIREDERFEHLRQPGIRLVPGYGAEKPLAMVVGEAPGATENEHGRPFCGVSGQVLHQLMALAYLRAEEVIGKGGIRRDPNIWLTNVVKYRPPGNRTPSMLEILHSRDYLLREWRIVGKPRLIVCVGSVAASALNAHSTTQIARGDLYPLRDGKTWVAYQFHPAFGLRGGKERRESMEKQWAYLGQNLKDMKEELGW